MPVAAAERPQRSYLPKVFAVLAPLIYAVETLIVRGPHATPTPVIALAVTIDLTVVVPLLYWMLVVRPAGASPARVVAAFVVSLIGARIVLPPEQREYLHLARHLATPLELALFLWIGVRVRRFSRDVSVAAANMDVPERIRAALLDAMPYRATAEVFASEMSLFWYAFASWGRAPHVPAGARGFTYYRRSGLVGIFLTLLLASVAEMVPMHFLLRQWSPRAAWALTALGVLATIWILGFLRAVLLRPILLDSHALIVRSGIRWTIDIPLDAIERVDAGRVNAPARGTPGFLRAVIAAQPNFLVTLTRPLVARGLYGTSRTVTCVAAAVDEVQELKRLLDVHMAGAERLAPG